MNLITSESSFLYANKVVSLVNNGYIWPQLFDSVSVGPFLSVGAYFFVILQPKQRICQVSVCVALKQHEYTAKLLAKWQMVRDDDSSMVTT
jgi:hypothetical protein